MTAMQVEDDEPVRFTGAAMRMDGKPVEEEGKKMPVPLVLRPSPAAADERSKRALRFGSSAAAGSVKGEAAGEKDGGKRFTGKKYSLQD
ncbi:hypothetical protein E2562_021754 [Oryza meyeriana var. granulata]|uniref:Uncharacterized protein n=1 Tax=Oryza meyeriana var. granulata TaxID=110450 RepID=A0A6G1EXZ3_9ORYZ|nr:hypothetical protein E2562_021754 [Oryza meyeriana var. granulata]